MDSHTILSTDLKQQILLLGNVVQWAHDNVQGLSTNPGQVTNFVNQLSTSLDRLNIQVTQFDDDHNNLLGLAETGQAVNSSLELNDVLRIVMDNVIRLSGAERGFLMLRENGGSAGFHLVTRIARNWEQESLNSSESAVSQTVVNRVLADGQPVVTTNAQEDPRFGGQESIIAYNLRSILCVPLKLKGEVTGVIYADNRIRTGIFTESKRNLLQAFANQAAVAIENARLFESVRRTLAEVTELKNLMDNVFASIASGVITSDIEDKILLCNLAAENILGKKSDTIIGQNLFTVLLPLFKDLAPQIEAVRRTDRQLVGLEVNPVLPDRGPLSLSLNLSPLKDVSQTTQGVAIVVDDMTEKRRLQAQRRLFERMVSPKVIEQLDPDKLQLGGRRTSITSLFADVRGFTSFSEKYDPEQLVSILNRYLKVAGDAVLAEEGTIDKFLGDAIMAWFNAPIPQPDHSLRAVRAALALVGSVKRLHSDLPPEFHLNFGVGIHYGDAVLGLVGTETRLDYTAIGDSVNTAKRIQENAAGGQILISEDVFNIVAEHVWIRLVDPVHAKGKSQPLIVYEVLSLKE